MRGVTATETDPEKTHREAASESVPSAEPGGAQPPNVESSPPSPHQSGGQRRSYDSVLEEIQAIFAGLKVKTASITSLVHQCQRERRSNKPKQNEKPRHHPSPSPSDVSFPSLPPPYHRRATAVCTRVVSRLPSTCSFNPLQISLSPKERSTHDLGERKQIEPTSSVLANSGNVDSHQQDVTAEPRVDTDALPHFEECRIYEEHVVAITSPRKPHRHSHEEGSLHTQPERVIHQNRCQQTVVRVHDGCHLHQRDRSPSPRPGGRQHGLSPRPEASRTCQTCYGSSQQEEPQKPADSHHSPIAHMTGGSSEQVVLACSQRLSSWNVHGKGYQEEMEVCGVLHKKGMERKTRGPSQEHETRAPTLGCYLHREPHTRQTDRAWQGLRDPLVWTRMRARKPKPCSVHRLDKVTALQHIPAHIVRQYLQGRRRCPPRWRKQKCEACMGPLRDKSPCQRELTKSDASKCSQRRGKLSRLALSRVLIVKPVPKESTSQGLWTRKEFEACSECRDLKVFRSVGLRSGRWSSILDTMEGDVSSPCRTKRSCHTIHGLSLPGGTIDMDLHGPKLHSASRIRQQLQQLQSATFDRRAAMQVAEMEGIELDKEVFDLLPEAKPSQKGSARRSQHVRRRKRWEVYRGLSKIVELPVPTCQQYPPRDVGVQEFKGKTYHQYGDPVISTPRWI